MEDQLLSEEVTEDVVSEEVLEQEEVTEEVEETEEEAQETPEEEEPEAETKPSHRETLRIQQLLAKMKQQPEPEAPKTQTLNYGTALDADPEVLGQLEADRKSYGDERYNAGLEQAKSLAFHTRLELDAPKVESKYPQFDKSSPEFNPAAADAINNWYLATAGFDPQTGAVKNADVRYADFVEGIMELADEIAGEKTVKATKNIAKQAAKTSLRPDGSTAKRLNLNQAPESMTDEELDAIIAQSIPKR